jgi:hypothetical protein
MRSLGSAAVAGAILAVAMLGASVPSPAAASVGWALHGLSEPSAFSPGDDAACEGQGKCDRYQVVAMNTGTEASAGTVTLTDTLPGGIVTAGTPESGPWECTSGGGNSVVRCTLSEPIAPGAYLPSVAILVKAPAPGATGALTNRMELAGAGAMATASASQTTLIGDGHPSFKIEEFDVRPESAGGGLETQASSHPWTLTTTLALTDAISPELEEQNRFNAVENLKNVAVELPLGLVGNAQVTPTCSAAQLRVGGCSTENQIGSLGIVGGALREGQFAVTDPTASPVSAVYNITPEPGYPAEFGFTYAGQPVFLYASVVRGESGYHVRVSVPGVPTVLETTAVTVTFFGNPGRINGQGGDGAFLWSPSSCGAAPEDSRLEVETWEQPSVVRTSSAPTYPQLGGCDLLQAAFTPTLGFAPGEAADGGTSQADEPSAYLARLVNPQHTGFSEPASPDLENARVVLPDGVALSPGAAAGLASCAEQGPEGINIGSSDVGTFDRDEGDPEATELGAGHAGGDGSPYDDGMFHVAPGHCPAASTAGTAEVTSPLVAQPLKGHVYVAAPRCGNEGEPACTTADAANGSLYSFYLEVAGSGVIVKERANVLADPTSGALTVSLTHISQFPLSEVKIFLHGGPRAPLANPQNCGTATTTASFEAWSSPGTAPAISRSSFGVDQDGAGGACPASTPFAPAFAAGTTLATAGAFSPLTLHLSRQDREQDLSAVDVTMPDGVSAILAGVARCPEPQASEGSCSDASLIGHDRAAAGAGTAPFPVEGRVYLTGPYKGAPFGLSIVTPAKAGPFNLGTITVRAAIHVDPNTGAISTTSDPLPQIQDGVPLRLRAIEIAIDRPGFIFNPTSCRGQRLSGTITSAQGVSAGVSSPFAVVGCAGLAFKPSFTVSTQARTSKKGGASLDVKVGYPSGAQANIHSVAVTLPKQLPARLTTIQQACPQATFAANPASCPAGSVIGTGTARTPILASSLTGPAYLVSHGGAAFPDLVLVLQGEGVTVDLTGSIDIKKGVTSSTFASVPDEPIGSFELRLPEGPHSGLTAVVPAKAKGSLCGTSLTMPTTLTGQNGAVLKQSTKIQVTGCPKAKKAKKKKAKHPKHPKAKKK